MRLQYRGVIYDHNPSVLAVDAGKVEGKFRGHKWTSYNLKPVNTAKPSERLVYRGVEVK